jgi:hypothetical protein
MATKQEYKEIIERKLSAESDENQSKEASGGNADQVSGGTDGISVTNKEE